jgi:hypothetical protein
MHRYSSFAYFSFALIVCSRQNMEHSYHQHAFPAKRQGASAVELQVNTARILALLGLAKFKQDPVKTGFGVYTAQPAHKKDGDIHELNTGPLAP